MPLIVNLSTIHTLHPIKKSVDAFAQLCNDYSDGSLSCCPTFFRSWSNYAWVMYQYQTHDRSLIQPYRLGAVTTPQFLSQLQGLFPFLNDLSNDQDSLRSTDTAVSLLEDAWNASIDLDQTRVGRLATLMNQGEPIYLISNTNELNVRRILQLLRQHYPEIQWKKGVDISVQENKEPIEIAPNIFLCLSYRFQLFKNRSDTPNSTTSLIQHLVNGHLAESKEHIRVISQFPGDLAEASRLGIAASQIFPAEQFYNEDALKIKKA
ncbi:MAG: hypothetical protein EPN84_02250 [Legionella sp.]|nr:MAG: hypothetical protein EPN84_02250 [Legionella sp.]